MPETGNKASDELPFNKRIDVQRKGRGAMRPIIFLLLFIVMFLFIVPTVRAAEWLYGWQYRKGHALNGAAGAGTGYQVPITIYFGTGTDSGGKVYVNGKSAVDFSDIRFTDNDGTTVLNYWLEAKTDSNSARFWVKVNDDLGSNQTIYVYYGGRPEPSASNGSGTFDFFDDFSGDLSKWTKHKDSAVISIVNGYCNLQKGTLFNYGHAVLGSSVTYTNFQNGIIQGKVYLGTDAIAEIGYRGNFAANTGYKGRVEGRNNDDGVSHLKPPYTDGSWGFISGDSAGNITKNAWLDFTLTVSGTSFSITCDGRTHTVTDATYAGPGEISLQNHYGEYARFDDIRIRKYVKPQPSHGSWAAEEEMNEARIAGVQLIGVTLQ